MSNLFDKYGIFSDGMLHVSPKETLELCLKGSILIDVREDYMNAFKRFNVPDIIYIPQSEIEQKLVELPNDKPLIIADSAGLRSKEAAQLLLKKGFSNIANLAGGLIEWERDGLQLIIDTDERLTGSCMCQLKPREKKKSNEKRNV
jgi:rhodanese-related sulfurtransferase